MTDSVDFVPRTELEARFVSLEARLGRVEKASADMTAAQTVLQTTIDENTHKLDDILGFLQHANTWIGFAKKHAPKIATFALGIAVTKGWITADNGRNFLHIFGM